MDLNTELTVLDGILYYKDGTKVSSSLLPSGYIQVSFKNPIKLKPTTAHRIIYFLYYGVWSTRKNHVDHIDGNKQNNKIENLRLVSHNKNIRNRINKNKNNTSGEKNICRINNHGYVRFRVVITKDFKSLEEAKLFRNTLKNKE